MQFVADGYNIPETLLDAHEEGRVVFFCGAGISYPAGLPGFKKLVDKIYHLVDTTLSDIEKDAYKAKRYDATLNLLEHRLPGQRFVVRKALYKALQPNLRRKGTTDTHTALLQLARSRKGALRLVTTNFDCIFERVSQRTKQALNTFVAPMLPIPNSRWDGIVYLHGRLPQDMNDEAALNRLVLTSGDFGLAYLTERWASRFVSELFRNYIVCFVGYSINDPVLRYMMDALAAARMLGETIPQAYAFSDCPPGKEKLKTIKWRAEGITPIFYDPVSKHAALHRTLKAWAETYRDGVLGKEHIVMNYALAKPSASTQQDNFVSRMLWALSDPSGLPAKRFAEFNPAPSLDWLRYFSDEHCQYTDLTRFGVPPRAEADNKLTFSLIRRPAYYVPWIQLVTNDNIDGRWDDVMFQLAHWLTRHLNDPALVLWVAQRGGQLHENFTQLINDELERVARLKREGKTADLETIRANAPNAMPGPLMRTLWNLLMAGRVKSPKSGYAMDLYHWKDRLQRDGLTTTLRLELRKLLSPKVTLRKPFLMGDDDRDQANAPQSLRQLFDCEIVLTIDRVHFLRSDLAKSEHWHGALPMLLCDFQQLLRDALDLFRELGEVDDHSDRSFWDIPSISPHWQNRGLRDWVALIELVRDAWLAVHATDPSGASRIAQDWFAISYPTFKRLALFAASHDECIPPEQWVDWLTNDDAWWLWSKDTQRETMRLLVLQGASLAPDARTKLETAILAGPPHRTYHNDLAPERRQFMVDWSIRLRLAKLQEGGSLLGKTALERFNALSAANPKWKLSYHERDEFPNWMSGTDDPYFKESLQIDITLHKRKDLVEWLKLKQLPLQRPFKDTWRETCKNHFANAGAALNDLSKEGIWPIERWKDALYAWTEDGLTERTWRCFAPLAQAIPNDKLQELASALTWWLEKVSETIDSNEEIFLDLCRRIMTLSLEPDDGDEDNVFRAVSHPVGHVTKALLNLQFKRKPNDNEGFPDDIKLFFTQLCDTQVEQFRHGRVLLASNLIALFRVDTSWTEAHLLPLFNWDHNLTEAKAVWKGFLWSPRLYQPLLIAIKEPFLATASHYTELGNHTRQQFAAFLTYVALDSPDGYAAKDFQKAIGKLPQEGLNEVAQALVQDMDAAGEQRAEYWKNRILPFWHEIWPKYRDLVSHRITESLALLAISASGEFPAALSTVIDWLSPIEHPYYVMDRLYESGLSKQFPEDALRLLDVMINDQPLISIKLKECLATIEKSNPTLQEDARFKRLSEYLKRHGI